MVKKILGRCGREFGHVPIEGGVAAGRTTATGSTVAVVVAGCAGTWLAVVPPDTMAVWPALLLGPQH